MRWLVDECVDAALVELLRKAAEAEGRLLLTEDKDFGDLGFRQARRVPGIVRQST